MGFLVRKEMTAREFQIFKIAIQNRGRMRKFIHVCAGFLMSIEVTVRFQQADGEVVNFDNQAFWSCTAFLRPYKITCHPLVAQHDHKYFN